MFSFFFFLFFFLRLGVSNSPLSLSLSLCVCLFVFVVAWTPPEVREQRAKERELERLERDTRTVFASNLSTTCGDRDLFDFFSEVRRKTQSMKEEWTKSAFCLFFYFVIDSL